MRGQTSRWKVKLTLNVLKWRAKLSTLYLWWLSYKVEASLSTAWQSNCFSYYFSIPHTLIPEEYCNCCNYQCQERESALLLSNKTFFPSLSMFVYYISTINVPISAPTKRIISPAQTPASAATIARSLKQFSLGISLMMIISLSKLWRMIQHSTKGDMFFHSSQYLYQCYNYTGRWWSGATTTQG